MELRHRGGEPLLKEDGDGFVTKNETFEDQMDNTETAVSPTVGNSQYYYSFISEIVAQAFHYLYFIFTIFVPTYEPQLDETIKQRMETFRLSTSNPYNSQDPRHENKLNLLWNSSFPEEQLERISHNWGKLGFQGKDPATDFRGGGIFALDNLLYFATKYPKTYQEILQGKVHTETFPVAITGLNITMLLFEMLGWGMKVTKPTTSQQIGAKNKLIFHLFGNHVSETAIEFQEFYCIYFDLFDKEWLAMGANRMDFQTVKLKAKEKLEALLVSSTMEDIKQNVTRLV